MLAIISSPFQLICLKEFVIVKKIEDLDIVLICESKVKSKFIKSFDFLKLKPSRIIYRTRIMSRINIFLYTLIRKRVKNLILGNLFDNHQLLFLKIIKSKNVTLIDDGMGSINQLQNNFVKKIKIKYKTSFDFFSVFDLPQIKNKLIQNQLTFLKNIFSLKIQSNFIFIIGQPLTHFISRSKHKEIMEKIINQNYGFKLKYFPHRREDISHLESQFINNNIEVVNTNEFFELFLIKQESFPLKIISFYSTVLLSSAILFNDSTYGPEIESVFIKKLYSKPSIRRIYDYFKLINKIKVKNYEISN